MTTQIVKFIRQWGGNDQIIWVDVAKLNASWRGDRGYYLPRRSPNGTRQWLVRLGFRRVPMPHIVLDEGGTVTFTDGRHRFGWFRDQGVKAIPITVATKKEAKIVRKRFGSRRKVVRLP